MTEKRFNLNLEELYNVVYQSIGLIQIEPYKDYPVI